MVVPTLRPICFSADLLSSAAFVSIRVCPFFHVIHPCVSGSLSLSLPSILSSTMLNEKCYPAFRVAFAFPLFSQIIPFFLVFRIDKMGNKISSIALTVY